MLVKVLKLCNQPMLHIQKTGTLSHCNEVGVLHCEDGDSPNIRRKRTRDCTELIYMQYNSLYS